MKIPTYIYIMIGFLIWSGGTVIIGEFLYNIAWVLDHGLVTGICSTMLLITIIFAIGAIIETKDKEEEQ